jgi:putative peptidoglycan lipid II flippase
MPERLHRLYRKRALFASFWVILFTGISFFGFFLRDYLMARTYGFGVQLDRFYLATMIPMFIVTVFCIPFGQAVVSNLRSLQMSQNEIHEKVRYFAYLIFLICLFLCFVTYTLSDLIIHFLHYFGWIERSNDIKFMQLSFLPILLLSGLVILGNAILSILERYVLPIVFQLIVPIFAIIFLFILDNFLGVYAVILGMVLGQLTNLILVNYALKQNTIKLLPLKVNKAIFKDHIFFKDYSYLVTIAIFSAIIIPINTLIASSLGGGSVSVFNLGIKFSLSVIGILTTLFTVVLLPYLARLNGYKNLNTLNKETFYLFLCSTLIFIPFCLIIYFNAISISKFIFSYISNENATVLGIASVIKYSIIQLPFWIFNAIVFKYANAIRKLNVILLFNIIMIILNILFGLSLIKYMNVGGLSLAITLSSAITALMTLIYFVSKKYLHFFESVFIFILWLIYAVIFISYNFDTLLILLKK